MVITPVLLAGGSGTRLWPVSRKSFPKQFAPLVGDETLFQASAKRLSGARYAAPIVMKIGCRVAAKRSCSHRATRE